MEIVTLDDVVWTTRRKRMKLAAPNTVGAMALAAAICQLEEVGMENVARHEAELTAYACLERLGEIPGVAFTETDPDLAAERLGVIPFAMQGDPIHRAVDPGLRVRHRRAQRLFLRPSLHPAFAGLSPSSRATPVRQRMPAGDRSEMPGSDPGFLWLYNTSEDVDRLSEALHADRPRGEFKGLYTQNWASGEYHTRRWYPDYARYFSFRECAP